LSAISASTARPSTSGGKPTGVIAQKRTRFAHHRGRDPGGAGF
jgi:hypothetical protein